LDSAGKTLVTETQNGTVVGFAKLIKFQESGAKYGCILWIAVHPQYRLRGIAAALVNEGVEHLKCDGVKAVFASVWRRNLASLTTFRKQGFKKTGLVELWRLFSWRTFKLYADIWLAPGEFVLMHC